jgi:beta-glucosidase
LNPDRPEDIAAARLLDGLMNRWPLDAVFLGTYPDDVVAALQKHDPAFAPTAADLAAIAAAPVDFLGVNYYSPAIVEFDDRFPLGLRWGNAETNPDPVKAFNGPVRPDELRKLLLRIRDEYGNPPTFVTENGAGFGDFDEVLEAGTVRDPLRTDYILRHAAATVAARDAGADVRGYMCWSLFDNFEWIQGYTRRFGMVHVDFATQKRTLKQSFRAYRDMIARTRGD